MRILRLLSMIAVVACAAVSTWADDDGIGEATTGYPLEDELVIQVGTHNGVLSHIVSTTGGTSFVKYERTIADTIPWTVESDSDETMSYFKAIAAEDETVNGAT